jgi:predicted lipoprotein with Yx(FWY)xxD motif
LTRTSQPHTNQLPSDQPRTRGWRTRVVGATAALALAGSLTAIGVSSAQAQPYTTRKATVVKVVTRHPFGKMLATVHGRSLYVLMPGHTCTGGCLVSWPPLLMPRGKTIPLGTRCLDTAKFHRRLQVAYRDKRLYLFAGDSGSSVTGNGLMGFVVAKVKTGACP